MAFTIYVLIVAFVGTTSAAFYGEPENNNFPRFTMPKPFIPTFNPFHIHIPPPQMPRMPYIPKPTFLSESEIVNTKPQPGQSYSGVYASTNGKKGSVAVNLNGQVYKKQFPEPSDGSK